MIESDHSTLRASVEAEYRHPLHPLNNGSLERQEQFRKEPMHVAAGARGYMENFITYYAPLMTDELVKPSTYAPHKGQNPLLIACLDQDLTEINDRTIRVLAEAEPKAINMAAPGGLTPLKATILTGKLTSSERLVDMGADVNPTEGDRSPLFLAKDAVIKQQKTLQGLPSPLNGADEMVKHHIFQRLDTANQIVSSLVSNGATLRPGESEALEAACQPVRTPTLAGQAPVVTRMSSGM